MTRKTLRKQLVSIVEPTFLSSGPREQGHTLIECLKKMLWFHGQFIIDIIVNALNECSNTSGLVSPARTGHPVREIAYRLIYIYASRAHVGRVETLS